MSCKKNKKCASDSMHTPWGISDDLPILRQRDIKQEIVQSICNTASITVSEYAKKQRNLNFCTGCVSKIRKTEFQSQFMNFAENVHEDEGDSHAAAVISESGHLHDTMQDNVMHCDDEPKLLDLDEDLHTLSDKIKDLPHALKEKLSLALALSIRQDLEDIAFQSTNTYKNLNHMETISVNSYLEEQHIVLKALLRGFQGNLSSSEVNNNAYASAKIIEAIIHSSKPVVLPLHFREGLAVYNATKSKTALQILAAQSPYPSYPTVKLWIDCLQSSTKVPRPLGNIIIAIDNNQILKKKWSIRVDNTTVNTVITMVVGFELDKLGTLQQEVNLLPTNWRHKNQDQVAQLVKDLSQRGDLRKLKYESHLVPFVNKRLSKVVQEQKFVENNWQDQVDDHVNVTDQSDTKTCLECKTKNKKQCRKCKGCGKNFSQMMAAHKQQQEERAFAARSKGRSTADIRVKVQDDSTGGLRLTTQRYDERDEYHGFLCHEPSIPETYIFTPSMVNPNSYDSIRNCLLDIGKQAGIKKYGSGDRIFAVIYCDGVPYNLIQRMISCTYRCSVCATILTSRLECDKHRQDDGTTVQTSLEFDWVLVFPGAGHIEMNMLKAVVAFLWPVCWKEMVGLFNFRSEAALYSARKVSDHHKGWAICRIFRNALVDELLLPYVRDDLHKTSGSDRDTVEVSSSGFFKYLSRASNPNYTFMADVAFEILDSIFMFRAGVRTGRPDMIIASRAIFAKMWCGTRHPQYRELDVQDMFQRMEMPEEILTFADRSVSLNMTGVPCTGEGPDFRLEEINRNVQSFMPLAPKESDWVKVCANYQPLTNIKRQLFRDKAIDDSSSNSKQKPPQKSEDEELAVRAMFRRIDYFSKPHLKQEHVSVSGEKLNPELANFLTLSTQKYNDYVDAVAQHNLETIANKAVAVKWVAMDPILVTYSEVLEYEKIQNKTIAQLKTLIEIEIQKIADDYFRSEWEELWQKSVRDKSRKKEYIEFLSEVTEFVAYEMECNDGIETDEEDT